KEVMATLAAMEIQVRIWRMPVEIPNPIPFDEDTQHASYDPEQVGRFWRILQSTNRLFQEFRGRFIGKASPVHFFWGSFDMAVTRFSGRRALASPDDQLMDFCQSTYEAAANLGKWDRAALERAPDTSNRAA